MNPPPRADPSAHAPRNSARSVGVSMAVLGAVLVWGMAAAAIFGLHDANRLAYDPSGLGSPFGALGDDTLGVWSRWDSVWFLGIEQRGYQAADGTPAFFPLYPMLIRAISIGTGEVGAVIAGLAISVGSLAVALWFIGRLVALETDDRTARLAVLLIVLFPTSLFFTAVYSEALFLALSAGAFWFARTGSWAAAGMWGLAAALTRSAGVALAVPMAILFWQQRRELGPAARSLAGAAWIALVPAGAALFGLLLATETGDAFAFASSQDQWARELSAFGPIGGLFEGTAATLRSAGDVLGGDASVVLWSMSGGAVHVPTQNLELAVFGAFAIAATIGALRRLPLAYGAYAAALLAIPLSFPRDPVPLFSMSRFVVVVFPLFAWLAVVLRDRPRARMAWLAASTVGLAYYTARFATWQWVG